MKRSFCLDVRGEFACFTRPEMKVERVSYDVITPSAARAIFEAILWKPEIKWQVTKIEVLNPIHWINLRRNELKAAIPVNSVTAAMRTGTGNLGIFIEDDRQQRAGLFLRDVHYRLHAEIDNDIKYVEMFRRRTQKGQHFHQPYLGCREFACAYKLVESTEEPALAEDRELGWMLYDMDFKDPKKPSPLFFKAVMNKGTIEVPHRNSSEVKG